MSNGVPEEKRSKIDESDVNGKVIEDSFDYSDILNDIDDCQTQIDDLNEQAAEEILAVEMKYNKLRKPHFIKRGEFIAKIPQFWLKTFMKNPALSQIIPEDQQNCLKYLSNFSVEDCEDIKNGYKMIFNFDTNPYFENETLIKEFYPTGADLPPPLASPIKWKPGKNLLPTESSDKESRKRVRDMFTFFHWLTNPNYFNEDETSEVLKDEIWPSPLQFYMLPDIEEETSDEDLDSEDENGVIHTHGNESDESSDDEP